MDKMYDKAGFIYEANHGILRKASMEHAGLFKFLFFKTPDSFYVYRMLGQKEKM